MGQIIQNLSNPVWWFTTIFVAFLVSLAANYAKPQVDKLVGRILTDIQKRNQKWKRHFDNSVQHLLDDSTNVMRMEIRRSHYGAITVISFIGCIVMVSLFAIAASIEFNQGMLLFQATSGNEEAMTQLLDMDLPIYSPIYSAMIIVVSITIYNSIQYFWTNTLLSKYDQLMRDELELDK